jgi:hypothetical protein
MKDIKDYIVDESRTSDNQIKEYVASWLRQNRSKYKETSLIILNAMMDYFKSEMEYEESAPRGTQSSQYKEVVDLYTKTRDAYQLF